MDMLWGKALETLITRSPELGFGAVSLTVLVYLVRAFLAHLATHESSRRADQAACHDHQERITGRMELAFDKVAGVIDKNTAALARVEQRMEDDADDAPRLAPATTRPAQ